MSLDQGLAIAINTTILRPSPTPSGGLEIRFNDHYLSNLGFLARILLLWAN